MNYERIYEYRFNGIDLNKKKSIWTVLSKYIFEKLHCPQIILDPAAGQCEFINTVPAKEKWAIDLNESFIKKFADQNIKIVVGNNLNVELPNNYFDGVFVSNFLEHLHTQEEVSQFLSKMYHSIRTGGKIAVMGPNFKYVYKEYFDFADHNVILTELSVSEHLAGAGFNIEKIYPRFLPLSFRGKIPVHKLLVSLYLKFPFAWRLMGKQFLIIATKSN